MTTRDDMRPEGSEKTSQEKEKRGEEKKRKWED